MDTDDLLERSERQLDRVQGFFPRVDAKASFVFAMNTGLLAILFLNLRFADFAVWYLSLSAAVATGLIGASLYFTYRCTFPHLSGGKDSLIYFREIGCKTEANFIEGFSTRTRDAHTKDVLGQVWRNSEILKIKFDAVNLAFLLVILALIPWCTFIVASSILRAAPPTLL